MQRSFPFSSLNVYALCRSSGQTPTQSVTLYYSGNQARISELINLFSQHLREKESRRHIQPIRSMIKRLLEGANWKTCEGAENTISLPLMTAAFHCSLPLLLKVLCPAHARLSYISRSLYILFYVCSSAVYIVGVGTATAVKIEANSKLSVKKEKNKAL